MPDYSKGKIYKIWDNNYTKCYIGSTCEELSQRMARHRDKYKQHLQNKYAFTTSFLLFEEFGMDNCKIELIELYPCNSKAELNAREGFFIKEEICVNKVIPGRTKAQYYKDNIEVIKEYRRNNKEKLQERGRQYRAKNAERVKVLNKEWKQQNREKVSEYNTEYYKMYREANKEKLKEYKKQYYQKQKLATQETQNAT